MIDVSERAAALLVKAGAAARRFNPDACIRVVPADGGVRFYLLSDDNGSSSQRTLLLAFDWRPR